MDWEEGCPTGQQSGVVVQENWAPSVDQCGCRRCSFSVHLTDLLSIVLRRNGFSGVQKAVVDQTTKQWP